MSVCVCVWWIESEGCMNVLSHSELRRVCVCVYSCVWLCVRVGLEKVVCGLCVCLRVHSQVLTPLSQLHLEHHPLAAVSNLIDRPEITCLWLMHTHYNAYTL